MRPSDAAKPPCSDKSSNVFINEIRPDEWVDTLLWVEFAFSSDPSAYVFQLYESRAEGGFACTEPSSLAFYVSRARERDGFSFTLASISTSYCNPSSPGYGVALYDGEGTVVEFLSLDTSFVAAAGEYAAGVRSVMIGATPLPGMSWQRTGEGCRGDDFVWQTSSASVRRPNVGQVFTCAASVVPSTAPASVHPGTPSLSPASPPSVVEVSSLSIVTRLLVD